MDEDALLLGLLGQSFPGLRGSDGPGRIDGLGLFAATAWSAGPQGMAQRGIPLPSQLHQALAQSAARVAQARAGGTRFLAAVRRTWGQDEAFLAFVRQLAQCYSAATSGRIPLPSRGQLHPPEPITPPPQPIEVAGFEVGDLLGAGTMGRVYKARQKSLDRQVALKVLNRNLAEDDPTYVQRFQQEARAAARLQHPNIVQVIDQGICPRTQVQFIAFELIDGQTARQLMEKQGNRLEEREALAICLATAEALSCAEEHGIVHRDVKPDNILIGGDGIPKLADLGLAKRQRDARKDLTDPNLVVGTPHFMAPEQALGVSQIDVRADLYSLGVSLFHFTTGAYPFEGDTSLQVLTRKLNEEVPDPRQVDPRISSAVAQLVLWLTPREREKRYASARAAAEDLERVLAGLSPLGPLQSGQQPRASRTGRIKVGTASGAWSGMQESLAPVELTPPADLEPAAQALWRARRTGNLEALSQAEVRWHVLADHKEPERAARGRAGLALVQAWRGDAAAAERGVAAAVERDPSSREAQRVKAELERGLPARASFTLALARLSSLVMVGRHEDAVAVAGALRREFPSEPHPHLLLLPARRAQGDEGGFREALQLAWALHPSRERLDETLGGGLDQRVAELLVEHGRAGLLASDPPRMLQGVEGTQEKSNLVGGALRMGVACAHAALASPELEPLEAPRLLLTLAQGLGGLQYFRHAKEVLDKAQAAGPTAEVTRLIDEERRRIVGWEGVASPGIRPQRGRFACQVAKTLVERMEARVQLLARRQREHDAERDELAGKVAERAFEPAIRAAIRAAARTAGRDDPFAEVEAIVRDLEQVELEGKALSEPKSSDTLPAAGGGFFAKLKGAADVATRVAKQGQLKLKETQLRARQGIAQRALGQLVVTELARHVAGEEWLLGIARRALAIGAINAVAAEEEKQLREGLKRLS